MIEKKVKEEEEIFDGIFYEWLMNLKLAEMKVNLIIG